MILEFNEKQILTNITHTDVRLECDEHYKEIHREMYKVKGGFTEEEKLELKFGG